MGREDNFISSVGFPLIIHKGDKLKTWHFAAFSNILLEKFMPNLVSLQSTDIGQNSGRGRGGERGVGCVISGSQISGQSFIKEICHNSRNSNDIDMKLGPATKIDKRNKKSQNLDDYVMLANCTVIFNFPIYGHFAAIRKPNSGRIVCKSYIFINSNVLSYKDWKQN